MQRNLPAIQPGPRFRPRRPPALSVSFYKLAPRGSPFTSDQTQTAKPRPRRSAGSPLCRREPPRGPLAPAPARAHVVDPKRTAPRRCPRGLSRVKGALQGGGTPAPPQGERIQAQHVGRSRPPPGSPRLGQPRLPAAPPRAGAAARPAHSPSRSTGSRRGARAPSGAGGSGAANGSPGTEQTRRIK